MRRLTLFFVAVLAASLLIVVAPAPPPAQAVTENNEILVTNQYGGSTCNLNQQLLVANPFTGALLHNYGKPSGLSLGVFNEAKPFDLNRKVVALWGGSSSAGQVGGVGVYDRVNSTWSTGWAFNSSYGIETGANSPHSITVLPDGYFAVAHVGTMNGSGSGFVIVFSPTGTKIQELPLSSAHGVEWDATRNALFAVGMSQIKKYTYSTSTHLLTEVTLSAHSLPTSGGHDLRRRRTDTNYFVTTNSGSYIYNPDNGTFQTLTKTSGSAVGGGVKSVDQRFDGVTEYSYYDNDSGDVDYFEFLDRAGVARGFCGNWYKAGRWLYAAGEKVYPEDTTETAPPSSGQKIGFGFPDSHATAARTEGGVKLTYTSSWAVAGDISGVDDAINKANAEGTIPVIHWYYWGDQITAACVDNYSGTPPADCPGKTRQKWDQGATALADRVYSMLQGRPAVITLELEFHKTGLSAYENLDGYLETQANLLKRPGISVALGWGEWASDTTYAAYDRAQNASHYAGTQILFSCIKQSLTTYRNAVGRVIENANKLEARYGKPVFVYDWAASSFSEEMSGDSEYSSTISEFQCVTDPDPGGIDYETEQNAQVAQIFSRKQELKDAGVIGFMFRALEDDHNRDPYKDYHEIAERWFGFRHDGVKKPAWTTVMDGITAENGAPEPEPDPDTDVTDEWKQEAEAFTTRSVGGECTDSTASGGKCWNIWSNGSISTTTSSLLTSGVKQVTVKAKGDPADGVWPKMRVKVDGATVMDLTVSRDTWGAYSAAVTLGTGTHTVEVSFTNDANVSGDDRNLLVDYADIDPASQTWREEAELFPTKTAGGECTTTTGSGGKCWNLWSNGYIETTMNAPYTSQHEVHVAARGRVAGGVWPIMEVSIDGTVVLTQSVSSTSWTTYKIRRTLSGGSHTLRIRFTNDAVVGSEDRNLELDVASLYT